MEAYMKQLTEEISQILSADDYEPMTVRELEAVLTITNSDEFKALVKTLVQMEQNGLVVRSRSDRYKLPETLNMVKGKLIGHVKGFAFVAPEDKTADDIFIPAHEIGHAMHGDIVMVRVFHSSKGNRREGTVVRVIEHGQKEVVGTFVQLRAGCLVTPDDKKLTGDILISKEFTAGAVEGHKVVVELTRYPDAFHTAEGKITRILGHKNDPGVDILSIIYHHGLPQEFPEEALEEANKIKEVISERDLFKRRDLRDETIVTIDGADAKDLDDAVTVVRLDNGHFKLGVHIADVSYYIKAGSDLDKEAYERATSVYLVDRVIPMIPHRLSNGICSLNPQVDRLTLSCEMEIDMDGQVVSHEIFQSVIKTTARMTYSDVNDILISKDQTLLTEYEQLIPMFQDMEALAAILRQKRMTRGSIDFDFKEAKVLVNDVGIPTDVVLRDRSVAEKLIEEFMLAANETVAEHFHWLDVPFIYRIHEDPNEEKLQKFFEFILNFGLIVRGSANGIHPRAFQEILDEIKGKPEEMVVSKIMLRSMKQAKYDPESLGHFGLSTDFYTHFTSPIRRYPDLIVHRLIREYLIEGHVDKDTQEKWEAQLGEIANHSSEMERRSVSAERDTEDLKKAEYLADKIGEEFTGIISSVTNFGVFVELPNTIEGLVHVSNMNDDYYHFNERDYTMVGERSGRVYQIGEEIAVQVAQVNIEERTIDFKITGIVGSHRKEKPASKIFKVNQNKKLGLFGAGKGKRRATGQSLGSRPAGAGGAKSASPGFIEQVANAEPGTDGKETVGRSKQSKPVSKTKPASKTVRKKNPFYENAPKSKRSRKKK